MPGCFLIMLPVHGFHIEPTNICTLRCAGCARTRFIQQWPTHWRNAVLDTQQLMKFLDLDLHGLRMALCGNYGDPIYHPDLAGMIRALKSRGAHISITTNGSHRSQQWWQDLAELLDQHDQVVFSIDGMPDDFVQYRENGDWPSILTAIQTCRAHDVPLVWKCIAFAYNQHHLHDVADMAHDLDMAFELVLSDRFDDQTQHLKPHESLVNWRDGPRQQWQQREIKVHPECQDGRSYYVSATGHFSPCCYVSDHRFLYKTMFGQQQADHDITLTTFSEIMTKSVVVKWYQDIQTAPPTVCQFNCPARLDQQR